MKLSPDQAKALDAMGRWLQRKIEPTFVLAGFAGSGKTTIVQEFINALTVPVICCAPTGKAADVLRKRLTSVAVTTIHRVLYKPVPPPSAARLQALERELAEDPGDEALAEAVAEERFRLASLRVKFVTKAEEHKIVHKGDLVIVDEASMVTRQMYEDFIKTGAFILFVGDPGQLPPVQQGNTGFFDEVTPDAILTEIHRQAADSPILQLSLRIRKGEAIAPFELPNCRKVPKTSMPFEQWLDYDQVITGSNNSRRRVNRFFRKVQGRTSDYPQQGDKLICLQNAEELFFINGAMGRAEIDFVYSEMTEGLVGHFTYDGKLHERVFDPYPFRQNYDLDLKERPWYKKQEMADFLQFDYAYAITGHKSQGSEWDRVILADDQMMADKKEFRRRWLYTAVTRAKEELVWLY